MQSHLLFDLSGPSTLKVKQYEGVFKKFMEMHVMKGFGFFFFHIQINQINLSFDPIFHKLFEVSLSFTLWITTKNLLFF